MRAVRAVLAAAWESAEVEMGLAVRAAAARAVARTAAAMAAVMAVARAAVT